MSKQKDKKDAGQEPVASFELSKAIDDYMAASSILLKAANPETSIRPHITKLHTDSLNRPLARLHASTFTNVNSNLVQALKKAEDAVTTARHVL